MIRILIVDDQNLVREGIKILLEKATEIQIVDDAKDGNSALEKIALLQPDIVLLDVDMPGIDGLAVADKINHQFPQVKIIMLSGHDDESYVGKSIQLGAKGYLLKSASSQELEWSIKLVYQGYSTIKSELLNGHRSVNTDEEIPNPTQNSFATNKEIPKISNNSYNNNSHNNNLHNSNSQNNSAATILSERDQANLDKLELLLAKNHVQQKYSNYRQQKPKTTLFHDVKVSQIKKTIMSFEFKLLVFLILFSLGFLIFIALSPK